MVKETIGGRTVDIEKEGSELKVVFHPIATVTKYPNAGRLYGKDGQEGHAETLKKLL